MLDCAAISFISFSGLAALRVAVFDCCIVEVNSDANELQAGRAEVDQTLRHYACSAKLSALSLGFLNYSTIKVVLTSKVDKC